MPDQPDQPKIIIDSDWKSQAQAEKERLSEQEKSRPAGAGSRGPEDMPPADFRALVGSLATQALLYMGAFPDPETGQAMISLEYAKHAIDMLGVLEVKTRGNLDAEEQQDITEVLNELRQRFVHITGLVANAQKQRTPGTPGPGTPGSPGIVGGAGGFGGVGMSGPVGPMSPFSST